MTDLSDLEHDTGDEYGGAVGQPEPMPPKVSDKHLDREERRRVLAERRARERVKVPQTTAEAIKQRYRILKYPAKQVAAQDDWLSFDNPEIWTDVI